jgi:hypothetical protein
MENMGRQKLVDKTIVPQEAVPMPQQLSGLTIAQALQQRLGTYLIGGYKGQSTFLDLDKLVNEPLALVEGIYSMDRIDARDIITATVPAGAAIGDVETAQLVVPAGELWLLNRVTLVSPAESGGGVGDIVQVNFRISAWQFPDTRLGTAINDNGRAYWAAGQGTAAADTYTVDFPAQGELGAELRLKAGDVITLVATLTGAIAGANLAATLTPFGRKIRRLVA